MKDPISSCTFGFTTYTDNVSLRYLVSSSYLTNAIKHAEYQGTISLHSSISVHFNGTIEMDLDFYVRACAAGNHS